MRYMHQNKYASLKNGKRVIHEEGIYEGTLGLTIKFFHSENDDTYRITIIKRGDVYIYRTYHNGEKSETQLSFDDLMAELEADDRLQFIREYLLAHNNKSGGRRRVGSRRNSRFPLSRRTSRRTRQSSRRTTRNRSRQSRQSRRSRK